MVDLSHELAQLANAEAEIAAGEARIARQETKIATLRAADRNVKQAVALLAVLHQVLAQWHQRKAQILRSIELAELRAQHGLIGAESDAS
jgi:hypothetical protein